MSRFRRRKINAVRWVIALLPLTCLCSFQREVWDVMVLSLRTVLAILDAIRASMK